MNTKVKATCTFLALFCCLTVEPCAAQTAATGAVLGVVTDPSGGVVAGAAVELLNSATGAKSSVVTGTQGQYAFPGVSPGKYTITVSSSGFRKTTVTDVDVQVNSSAAVNLKLTLGETSSTVSVTASEAQVELQTADATVGDVMGTQALLRLPTRLRQAQELLLLQPGTTPQTGSDNGGSIAGALNDQTTFTLDGIDITDNSTNSTINSDQGARPVLMFSVEADGRIPRRGGQRELYLQSRLGRPGEPGPAKRHQPDPWVAVLVYPEQRSERE